MTALLAAAMIGTTLFAQAQQADEPREETISAAAESLQK